MDVVQILNTSDHDKDDLEEVLYDYLKEKRLLTVAYNNKTKRNEILWLIFSLDTQYQNFQNILGKDVKVIKKDKDLPVVVTAADGKGFDLHLAQLGNAPNGSKNKPAEDPEHSLEELEAHPERILHLVRMSETKNFQLDDGVMEFLKDNETFKQSFENVRHV